MPSAKRTKLQLEHGLMHIALHAPVSAHRKLAMRYLGNADILFAYAVARNVSISDAELQDIDSHIQNAQIQTENNKFKNALKCYRTALSALPGLPGWVPPTIPPVPD